MLLPPPEAKELLSILPTEFSTTTSALVRSGLINEIPKLRGKGMTLFAPSNRDWQKLGFKLNAFLFSDYGKPYLRAVMKYHISPNHSLYSDAVDVPSENKEVDSLDELDDPSGLHQGYSHVDLPTLLKDRRISVDITRLERFLSFRVNGMTSISTYPIALRASCLVLISTQSSQTALPRMGLSRFLITVSCLHPQASLFQC